MAASPLDDRDRASPSGRRLVDLHRKARDLEAVVGQGVEVGELLHVAIADLASGLVAFPDEARVTGLGEALGGTLGRPICYAFCSKL